jgi:hypothetical protein
VFEDDRDVAIEMRWRRPPNGVPVRSATVVHARFVPNVTRSIEGPELGADTSVDDLAGWPDGISWPPGDGELGWRPNGWFDLILEEAQESPLQLPRIQSGWMGLGVLATDVEGNRYFPMFLGPVHGDAGHHVVTFDLVPTGSIEGRVSGTLAQWNLAVALADERGRLLPLVVPCRRFARTQMIDGDGSFRIGMAPAGRVRLRMGSWTELEAGTSQRETIVDVPANGTVTVVID